MNIGIDVDGVLTDFEWFIDYFGEKYLKSRKQPHNIVNETVYGFAEKFNCSYKTEKDFYLRYLFWYAIHMPIVENAAETIKALRSDGNKIYIITARVLADKNTVAGGLMRFLLKRWLRKNNVCYDGIYFVNTKNSAKEKVRLTKWLKLDWFIEDSPDNIEEIKKCCKVICLLAKYNFRLNNVYRAVNFADVYSIISSGSAIKIINKNEWEFMNHDERYRYFKNLKDKIKMLPCDKNAMKKYEISTKWIVRTVGYIIKSIFSININNPNLLLSDDNVIYVSNHRQSMDIPISYCLLNDIYARFISKREYQFTALSIIQRALGTIWIGRDNKLSGKNGMMIMIQSIINKENLFIFPEGTRNRTDNILLPFKYGAVKIAQITGKSIIPIVIYKVSKFRYNIKIGNEFKISIYDDLEDKNNELWGIMKDMYIQLRDGTSDDGWIRL